MTTSENALAEFKSNWLAINLMSTLADAGQSTDEKQPELERLVQLIAMRVGQQTGATHGVVALATGSHRTAVRWMSPPGVVGHLSPISKEQVAGLDFSPEDIGLATRLRTPVIAATDVVGFLDFSMSEGESQFHTPDKQLLHVVAGWLALLQQREALSSCATNLRGDQQALLDYAITGTGWNSMLHEIWSVTEDCQNNGSALCEMVLRLISSRIQNAAALLWIWETEACPVEVADISDQHIFHQYRDLVEEHRDAVCKQRKLRAIKPSKGSGNDLLKMVVICPLTRLPQGKGVIALARREDEPEFTTVEAQALEIAAALLGGRFIFDSKNRVKVQHTG